MGFWHISPGGSGAGLLLLISARRCNLGKDLAGVLAGFD
jgi:hypothetical protein